MTKQKEIHDAIIIGYRNLVKLRYDYDLLVEKYYLPEDFDKPTIQQFKDYFLTHIYPDPMKRMELDQAFRDLDNYIQDPEKLIRLLMDSASLVFRYGRHLLKILMAGLKALKSFRAATDFEEDLVKIATEQKMNPPYSNEDMISILSQLPVKKIQDFMEKNVQLFGILEDRKLVGKIISIVEDLIKKMEDRPETYSESQINALRIGRNIIFEAFQLVEPFNMQEQQLILNTALQIERDFFEALMPTSSDEN